MSEQDPFIERVTKEFAELPPVSEVVPTLKEEKHPVSGKHAEEAIREWMETVGREGVGFLTSWDRIDQALGDGIQVEEVVLIAARTGVGKSWILQTIVEQELRRLPELRVLFLTLEMSNIHLGERLASHAVRLDTQEARVLVKQGKLTLEGIMEKAPELRRLVVNEHMLVLEEVGDAISNASEILGGAVNLVIVDYLGLLRLKGSRGRLYEVVSEVSRKLKDFAKKKQVAVLVAAQLSRGGGGAGENEPGLDSLRDSGVTEEAADRILMAWQEKLGIEDSNGQVDELPPLIKVKVAKNRFGPTTGPVTLEFHKGQLLRDTTAEFRMEYAQTAISKMVPDDIPF